NGYDIKVVNSYWDSLEQGRLAKQAERVKVQQDKAAADKLVKERFAAKQKAQPKAKPAVPGVRGWDEVRIPATATELERAVTYVPGLVGDATEWMVKCSRHPNRMMALGSSLAVVGTILGRLIMGPTGGATHLFVTILLPSGYGKDTPLRCGAKLVELVLGGE